jgi:DNA-binding transcriptional LysR family regulator
MAVSPVGLADPDLEEEVLLQEELFLVCAPALRGTRHDLEQLAALPWIVTSSPNAIRGHRRREKSTSHAERVVHGLVSEIGAELRARVGIK